MTRRVLLLLVLLGAALPLLIADPDTCHSSKEDCGAAAADPSPPRHFNIILVGATGNLATKYLWHALFETFRERVGKDSGVRFQAGLALPWGLGWGLNPPSSSSRRPQLQEKKLFGGSVFGKNLLHASMQHIGA